MPSSASPYALFLSLVLTAAAVRALTGATSTSRVPSLEPAFQDVQSILPSRVHRLWSSMRMKYGKALQGQLSLSDMVELLALCSVIPGIWIWRRQLGSQGRGIGGAEQNERNAGRSKKRIPWGFGQSRKWGMDSQSKNSYEYKPNVINLQMRNLQTQAYCKSIPASSLTLHPSRPILRSANSTDRILKLTSCPPYPHPSPFSSSYMVSEVRWHNSIPFLPALST